MRVRVALDTDRPTAATLASLIEERRVLLDGLQAHPEWGKRESELADLLASMLPISALNLVRIDARSPQPVLDEIIKYEAVHPIRDAQDLARRLANDRRCYAFFHPSLPSEPLIFAEVALTHCLSGDVRALLDPASRVIDPRACNCAIFYSISSCHEGLRGIPLGNALIRRASEELASVLPRLDTFATLSPIPGFRSWLESLTRTPRADAAGAMATDALAVLERAEWHADAEMAADLEAQLVPACAHYLLRVKRGDEPVDPVARFHLRNGARLERINWLGDVSPTGMRRSAGMMVNYVYRCTKPAREYDSAATTWTLQASREVTRLALRVSHLFL